jgi:hypothetical protein
VSERNQLSVPDAECGEIFGTEIIVWLTMSQRIEGKCDLEAGGSIGALAVPVGNQIRAGCENVVHRCHGALHPGMGQELRFPETSGNERSKGTRNVSSKS